MTFKALKQIELHKIMTDCWESTSLVQWKNVRSWYTTVNLFNVLSTALVLSCTMLTILNRQVNPYLKKEVWQQHLFYHSHSKTRSQSLVWPPGANFVPQGAEFGIWFQYHSKISNSKVHEIVIWYPSNCSFHYKWFLKYTPTPRISNLWCLKAKFQTPPLFRSIFPLRAPKVIVL